MVPYTIYKITNQVNGKMYIGITRQSLDKRWQSHIRDVKYPFQKAIQKYGAHQFKKEEIEIVYSEDEAIEKEAYWIKYFDSIKHGYNILPKGARKPISINTYKRPVVAIHILEKRPLYFESLLACAKVLNIGVASVRNIANGLSHTYHNYTFVFEDEFKMYELESILSKVPKKKNIKKQKVEAFILKTKEPLKQFNTLSEAPIYFSTSATHISSVCRGKRHAAGKYQSQKIGWRYI